MIKAGTYDAKLLDYGIGTTKDGLAQVIATFEIQVSEQETQRLTWYGSLKPAAEGKKTGGIDITKAALAKLGMNPQVPLRQLAKGPQGGALDMGKGVAVTVEIQTGQDGVQRPRIQWVGRSGAPNLAKEEDAINALKAMGLDDGNVALAAPIPENEVPF